MYTSYRISEEVNLQTVLWDVAGGIIATGRGVGWAWQAIQSSGILWALLYALVYLVGGLVIGAALLGVFAVICAIPPVVWPGLAGIAVYACVTYPR